MIKVFLQEISIDEETEKYGKPENLGLGYLAEVPTVGDNILLGKKGVCVIRGLMHHVLPEEDFAKEMKDRSPAMTVIIENTGNIRLKK